MKSHQMNTKPTVQDLEVMMHRMKNHVIVRSSECVKTKAITIVDPSNCGKVVKMITK